MTLTQSGEVIHHPGPGLCDDAVVGDAPVVVGELEVEVVADDDAVRVDGLVPGERSPAVSHRRVSQVLGPLRY